MERLEKVGIIGVPQDLGASRRGVDMGPSAMRIADLHNQLEQIGYKTVDYGNIACHDISEHLSDEKAINPKLRFIDHIVKTAKKQIKIIKQMSKDCFPLILGGDHSINIGTMAALQSARNMGVLWVDAHADFNTPETTISGNIHGMSLAIATGRGDSRLTSIGSSSVVNDKNAVIIGARDIDQKEALLLRKSEVSVFTMKNIDEIGFSKIAKKAIEIATEDVDYLHLSYDIDSLDPNEAPGTGTRVPGGLTYREAHLLMELVHETGKLCSMEMVEVNPTLDVRNKTAQLAVGLISSALGKKIF